MNFYERLQTVKRIHEWIRIRGTGSPNELARRINVSRATLFRLLEYLSSLGADIAYDNANQTYYYVNDFNFSFRHR